ncbi:MASE1 domain-containing sensor histidine kinase [Pragia fontium]|uniref:Two-component system, NarL family, sensor histidine kinase UhpB n=1 Tax=Pragia fontium DSM 5563 = ATCC 49100 TaxID=1122977 RepID=A0AAJ4W924_9GAMM|nr:MASE1 domain-containing protein [Pragia fontium]SFC40037.1 two-component system, NarL family, sensor histidine kinase UhpB [Pragia fontium DSM 5563 = ATCC 49100]VEJ54791.1 Oxygen sensor histidine kinase nreB [Pragia fontium]
MSRLSILHSTGLNLFVMLSFSLGWIALWGIGYYLNNDTQLAVLMLPQAWALTLLVLIPRRFYPVVLLSCCAIILWLYYERLIDAGVVLLSPWLTLLAAMVTRRFWYYFTLYWQRLLMLLVAVTGSTILHGLLIAPWLAVTPGETLLTTFTGGVLLTPFIYLLYEYLKQQNLQTLLPLEHISPPLKTSLLMWSSLFFAIGISIQLVLTPEIERLLLIFIFLPNVFMAYRFGWQGGVLATMLGSVLLIATRHASGADYNPMELKLFLSIQALLSLGLGIAVSRQQQLVERLERYRHQLERELDTRRQLTEQLVHTEEQVRKDIARELHDEIGQNITAIQIQAAIVNKTTTSATSLQSAQKITDLSQRIHQATRQLLHQLRPPVLDEMSLQDALRHLAQEFSFDERNIHFELDYRIEGIQLNDTVMFTLYRLVQELLNNINKHAQAKTIRIALYQQDQHTTVLEVEDDGIGIPEQVDGGFGLLGIEERVRALGGHWLLSRHRGTHITVNLPTNPTKNDL